jgi:uncharacterized protein (DUF952 family)
LEALLIYHLMTSADWAAAQHAGVLREPSLETEGFIHCSSAEQVEPVANRFYLDAPDLVAVVLDEVAIDVPVRWEPPAHPDGTAPEPGAPLFPHVYGLIPLRAVVSVVALRRDADRWSLP